MEVPLIHLSSHIYVLTAPWGISIPVTGGNDHFPLLLKLGRIIYLVIILYLEGRPACWPRISCG